MKTNNLRRTVIAAFVACLLLVQAARATTYYYKTTGTTNPALNTNWTTSSTGVGGTTPTVAQFNAVNNTLNLFNSTAAVSVTLTANWTTLGTGTQLNVGTSTKNSSIDFGAFTFNRVVNVGSKGTVSTSNSNPTFFGAGQFVYNVASTTIMSANGVTVPSLGFSSYGNLNLTGTSATLGGKVSIAGALTANAIVLGGYELDIAGTVTSLGTITGDLTGSIYITNGSTMSLSFDQTSPGTSNSVNTLLYDDAGAGNTLTLATNVNIAPGGVLLPSSGTIDASAVTLTLLADQTGAYTTGAIGDLSTGTLVGNITSQIYHNPAGNVTDWTLMGSPGINDPTNIFTAWNSSFYITCANCPNGSTAGGVTFTSITYYDEATQSYPDLVNITDALNPGIGVWVYEGNSSPGTSTPGELISVSGPPTNGNVTQNITGTGSGYNLLANPYPCPISWSTLYNNQSNATVVGSTYYVWSPNTQAYSQCDDQGVSVPSSGSYAVGDAIPTGQGFYVTSAGGGTFNFDESIKSPGSSQALLRKRNIAARTKATHFNIRAAGSGMTAETAIKFVTGATTGFENNYDGLYNPGTAGWLQMSTIAGTTALGINGMPALTQNYSVPLRVTTGTTGTYAFDIPNAQFMPAGACLMLHDNYTNTDYDLLNGPHNITLNDTETVARFMVNITITAGGVTGNSYQATCASGGDAYLTAVGTSAGPWNYTWKDANSNIVKTSLNKASADSLTGLGAGVYMVDVNTVGSCDNATQSFTLTLPAGVSSAFTVSSTTVAVNNSVSFTDNSFNADAWWWDFGDSTNSALQSPVHTYTNVGTYNAVLYAINTACGDTVASMFTEIDVQGTTGIASYGAGEFYVSRDVTGAFVKFNYSAETKVSVTAYNALGQVIYSNNAVRVAKDKMYLNLESAKDQMVFISVVNLDENTQVTKKLFNN